MTIDLRSDTLTRPTDAMRGEMAEAEVGADVYGEDPPVGPTAVRTVTHLGIGREDAEAAASVLTKL